MGSVATVLGTCGFGRLGMMLTCPGLDFDTLGSAKDVSLFFFFISAVVGEKSHPIAKHLQEFKIK